MTTLPWRGRGRRVSGPALFFPIALRIRRFDRAPTGEAPVFARPAFRFPRIGTLLCKRVVNTIFSVYGDDGTNIR